MSVKSTPAVSGWRAARDHIYVLSHTIRALIDRINNKRWGLFVVTPSPINENDGGCFDPSQCLYNISQKMPNVFWLRVLTYSTEDQPSNDPQSLFIQWLLLLQSPLHQGFDESFLVMAVTLFERVLSKSI